MLKPLTLAAVILLTTTASNAQIDLPPSRPITDSIGMRKMSGGYQFYHRGSGPLKIYQLVQVLQPNEQAMNVFKTSRAPRTFGTILGFTGGLLIGYPIGVTIGGGKPNWALAGVGAVLAAASFPLASIANRKVTKAVRMYNADVQVAKSTSSNYQLRFAVSQYGVGLALGF